MRAEVPLHCILFLQHPKSTWPGVGTPKILFEQVNVSEFHWEGHSFQEYEGWTEWPLGVP